MHSNQRLRHKAGSQSDKGGNQCTNAIITQGTTNISRHYINICEIFWSATGCVNKVT